MKRSLLAVTAAVALMGLTGCAPMARVAVTKPAEINLKGINKVVIGNIWGNKGYNMQDVLSDKLFRSEKYEVVDRASFDRITQQQNFSLGKEIDQAQAQRVGKILGTSVMVTGSSTSDFQYNRGQNRYQDSKGITHVTHSVNAKAKLFTRLDVIELSTGRVLGKKNIEKVATRNTSATDRWATIPNADDMVAPLIAQTAEEFMHMIAPYVVYVYVQFESATTPDGERGIQLAQAGQWSEAIPAFLYETTTAKEKVAGAWHNLALAYQYTFQYDNAKKAFKKCISIEPLSGCTNGLSKVDEMIRDDNRLKEQGAL